MLSKVGFVAIHAFQTSPVDVVLLSRRRRDVVVDVVVVVVVDSTAVTLPLARASASHSLPTAVGCCCTGGTK